MERRIRLITLGWCQSWLPPVFSSYPKSVELAVFTLICSRTSNPWQQAGIYWGLVVSHTILMSIHLSVLFWIFEISPAQKILLAHNFDWLANWWEPCYITVLFYSSALMSCHGSWGRQCRFDTSVALPVIHHSQRQKIFRLHCLDGNSTEVAPNDSCICTERLNHITDIRCAWLYENCVSSVIIHENKTASIPNKR